MPWVTQRWCGVSYRAYQPPPLSSDAAEADYGPVAETAIAAARDATIRLSVAEWALEPAQWALWLVVTDAVHSSQIEGIEASADDVWATVTEEADKGAAADLVARNAAAARSMDGVSVAAWEAAHWTLFGGEAPGTAGRIRRRGSPKIWVGGSTPITASYVPPPGRAVPALAKALSRWCVDQRDLIGLTPQNRGKFRHALVAAALAHLQFELIHPFLDGNGRIGRLLAERILAENGQRRRAAGPVGIARMFSSPKVRPTYYAQLKAAPYTADHRGWVTWFARQVEGAARAVAEVARSPLDAEFWRRPPLRLVE